MKISPLTDFRNPSPRNNLVDRLRSYWGGRRGLLALGAGALALGVGLNWGWLAAVGVAPVLIALLPCAAMCALGLCMPRMMKKPSGTPEAARDITLQATPVAPTSRLRLASSGTLPAPPFAARQPAIESVGEDQSCCHTSEAKENLNAKNN